MALIAGRMRGGETDGPRLTVRSLDERYDAMTDAINARLLDKKALKALAKARRQQAKAAAKSGARAAQKRIFVLDFKGDLRARAVRRLAAEIDAVLAVARPETDEVVLKIESPGGTVTGYGLAAAEMMRLTGRKVKVTACVDQVAASGGYLMACAADRIVAAPFALVGSIGVVAQIPNLHRLLKRNDIDYEEITAGEYKRSVSVLGEITPQGREHFRGKLDATHEAFKRFVAGAPARPRHRQGRRRRRLAGERGARSRPGRRAGDQRRIPVRRARRGAPLRDRRRAAQDPGATPLRRLRRRSARRARKRGRASRRRAEIGRRERAGGRGVAADAPIDARG